MAKRIVGRTVEVTAQDIKAGKKCSSMYCPIARALRRTLGIRNLSAGFGSFGIGKTPYVDDRVFNLPKKVDTFISDFDVDEKVVPFSFRIGKEIK